VTDGKVKICFFTATEYFHEEIRKPQGLRDFKQETFLRKPVENKDLVNAVSKMLEDG
jgi:hypothetical protein